MDEDWIGQYLPLADAAVTREVIETKRPAVVGSLRDLRLTAKVHEINRDPIVKSWATLPLIVKDRVIGTVELVESGAERSFTQGELDTAAAICHAAAMAIENAALFESEQAANQEALLLNRDRAAHGRQPRPRRGRRGGRRRAAPAPAVRQPQPGAGRDGRVERVISFDAHARTS